MADFEIATVKFTPGPWMIDSDDDLEIEICADIRPDGDYLSIALIRINAIAQANAKLISAAPDMYEALKADCDNCEGQEHSFYCDSCPTGKALRKARGEE